MCELLKLSATDFEASVQLHQLGFVPLAYYHMQQAVEKLFKALYDSLNMSYKRNHKIEYLVNLWPADYPTLDRFWTLNAETITEWEVSTKYSYFEVLDSDEELWYSLFFKYSELYKFIDFKINNVQ